ncbi:MAG: hypothetical protein IJH37_01240 [Clostridia bacterium]|nr:hypothetical protein [Clostridia bacterium]
MKKLTVFVLGAMMLSQSAAFAAEYDWNDNTVTGLTDSTETFRTVMIYKSDDAFGADDIVYIDQADNGNAFSSVTKFVLSSNPGEGTYIVRIGEKSGNTAAETLTFRIGSPVTSGDRTPDKTFIEDSTAAFGWEALDNASSYNSVLIKVGDRVFGVPVDFSTISGSVSLGLKITEIPEESIGLLEAYLSTSTISDDGTALNL